MDWIGMDYENNGVYLVVLLLVLVYLLLWNESGFRCICAPYKLSNPKRSVFPAG